MTITIDQIETAYHVAIDGMGYGLNDFEDIDTLDPIMGRLDADIADAILDLPFEEIHALARRVCAQYDHIIKT